MKKTILLTLIALITILSGYFMYKSYSAYQSYKIIQKSENYALFIKNLNITLQQIEHEHSSSAIYLGSNGKTDFNQLESIREKTDNAIKKTTLFVKNDPIFSSYMKNLARLSQNLQYVRSRVDVISSDYNSILFDYYQDEISQSLINEIKNNIQILSLELESLKKYTSAYVSFIEFRNSIDKEKSFIAFILSNSKKMSKEDLILWDNILKEEVYPSYDNLDNKIISDIKIALRAKSFSQLDNKTRVEVAQGVSSGHYQISLARWLKSADEKVKIVKASEKIIYDYFKKEIDNIVLTPTNIIINVLVLIFLLFLLLALLFSLKGSKKSKKSAKVNLDKEKEFIKSEIYDDKIKVDKAPKQPVNDVFYTEMSLDHAIPFDKKEELVQPPKPISLVNNRSEIRVDEVISFDPVEEFKSTIESFQSKARGKNIEFSYYIDPSVPTSCIGNAYKIKRILSIIINHAIDFTPSSGTVKVNIDNIAQMKTGSAIKFSVIDTGSYISKGQKYNIRKAFYKNSITETKKSIDEESGLTHAGELISAIEGVYTIESEPKVGSTFFFTVTLKKSTV